MTTNKQTFSQMEISDSPKILITGAKGNIGTELCKSLSGKAVHYKAMVRSIAKADELAKLPGAALVQGDFDDVNSIFNAFKGIERAFLLTNSSEKAEEQQLRFVKAAEQAGVLHIVKLSQWAADADSPVRFLRYHAVVEERIRQSGLQYTFLRPNLFMQGLLGFRDTIRHQGTFFGAVGEARISMVDIRDIAAVAAASLTEPGHENKIYNLTGPEALSHNEVAEKLSAAVGIPICFVDLEPAALERMLLEVGFPIWQAQGLVEDYAHYKRGEAAVVTSGIADATGEQPRSFEIFANDYAALFHL